MKTQEVPLPVRNTDLTDKQLDTIISMVKSMAGINLHDGKKELIKARLGKRLRSLNMNSFEEYLKLVKNDSASGELTAMLDAISTNLTNFFREADHFEILTDHVLPKIVKSGKQHLRIWSAGCSTGEEPYSIGITMMENLPEIQRWDTRILATDLSTKVLGIAAKGSYPEKRLQTMSPEWRKKYFTVEYINGQKIYTVKDSLRQYITFGHLNLMGTWPMKGPFDVIFCRNVMIYFDKPTRTKLIERYWNLLGHGGFLFIGHSESLTGISHKFKYLQPTVYTKN
jgi:chemotaxis protein methyltransferase CheR